MALDTMTLGYQPLKTDLDKYNESLHKMAACNEKMATCKLEDYLGHSLETDKVDEALGKAQRDIVIKKTKAAHQYKYATLPEILSECYEVFGELGLVLKQPMWEDEQGRMELRTIITHIPSKQWISAKIAFPALRGNEKNDCQAIGGIQTYFRRYLLVSILGLAAEDEDAKEAAGYKVATQKPPQEYVPSRTPYNPSEYINDKQLYLLKSKMESYPQQAKALDGVDLGKIQKKEFNDILSLFPQTN